MSGITGTTNCHLTSLYEFLRGRCIWTQNVLWEAHKLHQKVLQFNEIHQNITASRQLEAEKLFPDGEYTVIDISGRTQTCQVPDIQKGQKLILSLKGVVEISEDFHENETHKKLLYKLIAVPKPRHETESSQCSQPENPWDFWKESWTTGAWKVDQRCWWWKAVGPNIIWGWHETQGLKPSIATGRESVAKTWSKLSSRLDSLIKENAQRLEKVDKVLCFGLGSLSVSKPRSFVQHLAARTVADALEKINGGRSIEVHAQDPEYCKNCVNLLWDKLQIHARNDLGYFFEINESTFIITISPAGPIRSIIIDLAQIFDGPAAMLCDEISDDCMAPEKMEGNWIDDEPTKNLCDYAKNCTKEYFGDCKDVMDRSWAQWKTEEKPFQDMNDDEKKLLSLSTRVSFGDVYLYIQK